MKHGLKRKRWVIARSCWYLTLMGALALLLLGGCGSTANQPASSNTAFSNAEDVDGTEKEIEQAKLVTAWYAKGEDGGLFAALQQGYFEDRGIVMEIEQGGPEVSTLQVVASGQFQFGVSYADDILMARDEDIPIIALMAPFQQIPQVFVYHKGANISGFEDIEGRTIYVTPGLNYWEFIKKKYELSNVKEMAYTGQLVNFIQDPEALNQGYLTNEPYALAQQGVEVDYLKIADSGYANYANVLFTTETYAKEHPEVVGAVIEATVQGWEYYLEHYDEVNPFIQEWNPDMSLEAMAYEAEQEKDLIVSGDAEQNGIGTMSRSRWELLQQQLIEMGILSQEQDIDEILYPSSRIIE